MGDFSSSVSGCAFFHQLRLGLRNCPLRALPLLFFPFVYFPFPFLSAMEPCCGPHLPFPFRPPDASGRVSSLQARGRAPFSPLLSFPFASLMASSRRLAFPTCVIVSANRNAKLPTSYLPLLFEAMVRAGPCTPPPAELSRTQSNQDSPFEINPPLFFSSI